MSVSPSIGCLTATNRTIRWLGGALLALTLAFCPGQASERPRLLYEYNHAAWGSREGAPVDILAIQQTTDGWLWLSTPTGLFRFDGVRFERMDAIGGQKLQSTNTMPLYAPADGGLWVGYRYGGASFFKDGRAWHYTGKEGLPPGPAMSFTQAADGNTWMTTMQGLARLDGAHWQQIGRSQGFAPSYVRQVLFDRAGTQWVSTRAGVYFRVPGSVQFQPAYPRIDLSSMAESPDGTIWASDGEDRNYRLAMSPPAGAPARPQAALPGSGMWFDREGTMWLFRANSVERIPPDLRRDPGQRITQDQGLSGGLPQTFFQDREGNIWIGTSAGLDRLRRNRFVPVSTPYVLDHPIVVADRNGAVWISSLQGKALRYSPQGEIRGQLPGTISAAYHDPDGTLWLADDASIWRQADQPSSYISLPPELKGNQIIALSRDRAGAVWVSVNHRGVFRYHEGRWLKNGGLSGLPELHASILHRDGAGRIWIGYLDNQLRLIDGNTVRPYATEQGLDLGNVLSLYSRNGHLWAGGERGVAYFDGQRFAALRGEGRQEFRGVSGLLERADGELWLHGADGVSRIAAADVARRLREPGYLVPFERFDAQDGLIGVATQVRPLPAMVEASDGALWLAMASEVFRVDPEQIKRNPVAPRVQIHALFANGQRHDPGDNIALPKGSTSLRIEFTALSYTIPERVRFRYQLTGVDSDWQNAGGRREAFYTNLAPGHYQFSVVAANEDGVWNKTASTLSFDIPPSFVQTPWFLGLIILATLGLLWLLYQMRLNEVTHRLRDRMQTRLIERERIARELHDTFLQGMQGLILRFQSVANRIPDQEPARQLIEQTLEQADQLLIEGRDRVMDLRLTTERVNDLAQAVKELGAARAREQHVDFTIILEGDHQDMHPIVRDEVYRIAQEALLNAFQHAAANRLEVVIGYHLHEFRLNIRDNGRGITQDIQEAGGRPHHWGLAGMRERAEKIGGQLAVWSRSESGTEVALTLPARLAYLRAPGERFWHRLHRLLSKGR